MIETFIEQNSELVSILTDENKITEGFLARLEKERGLNGYKRYGPILNDIGREGNKNDNKKWLIIYKRRRKLL